MSRANRQRRGVAPAWTAFERATLIPLDERVIARTAAQYRLPVEAVREQFRPTGREEVWKNSRYQVLVIREVEQDAGFPKLIWLSIKRLDKQPIHDWRDLQRIKNELVGADHEAVELYPAESRLTDTSNQFHLWVLAQPGLRFPFGFTDGRNVMAGSNGKSRQRPFETETAA